MPRGAPHTMNCADARARFLDALARLGTVRAARAETGENTRTLGEARYWHRDFDAAWTALRPTAAWRKRPRGSPQQGWRDTFIDALIETGSTRAAARRAGVSRTTIDRLAQREPAFRAETVQARAWAIDMIFGRLTALAMDGVTTTTTVAGVTTIVVEDCPKLAVAWLKMHDRIVALEAGGGAFGGSGTGALRPRAHYRS